MSRTYLRILPKLKRIDRRRLEVLLATFRRRFRIPRGAAVEVTIADDPLLAALNRRFRRRAGSTDVLAFSFGRSGAEPKDFWILGEVYVSVDRAREQAGARGVTLSDEVAYLVAHGLLHLVGFDHHSKEDREAMEREEAKLLAAAERFLERGKSTSR